MDFNYQNFLASMQNPHILVLLRNPAKTFAVTIWIYNLIEQERDLAIGANGSLIYTVATVEKGKFHVRIH